LTEPCELLLSEALRLLRNRSLSARELTVSCLSRIESHDLEIGAFARVFADEAMERAAVLDRATVLDRVAVLDPAAATGRLHGIPVAVKDLIAVKGHPTEAGSRAYAGYVPDRDAAVVGRLREAGAIVVGKTNTHELAFGVSTPSTRNPWSLDRMTGGSSGGSAAALAAGMVPAALGTDTGGSVRNPSSYCGTVGLKTTPGLIDRDGLFMISSSYDVIGPMTRSCTDADLLLAAMAGTRPLNRWRGDVEMSGTVVGLPGDAYYEGLSVAPPVERALHNKVDQIAALGASIIEVAPPSHREHAEPGSVVVAAEARLLHERILTEMPELVADDIREFIGIADGLSSADLAAAHKAVSDFRQRWLRMFDEVDFVISPVTPNHVPTHGLNQIEGVPLIPATTPFTFPLSGAGLAGLAVPDAPAADGLPVGVQIIGPPGSDRRLLALGKNLETAGFLASALAPLDGTTKNDD